MEFWQNLLSKLQESQNVYLITVIESIGSSPGRIGFKMLVAEDGFLFGSIGGGVMEFSLVEEAKKMLDKGELKIFLKRQIHKGRSENGSGMICSGEQTVVFHPMNSSHLLMVEDILYCLFVNAKGELVLDPNSIKFTNEQLNTKFEYNISSSQDWWFKERIGFNNTLYIVGGGHVSVAVSNLFISLGFYVVVFDNREELNTLENNTSAHQKTIVNFSEIVNYIPEGKESFVVIMTNRYVDDKLVLSKLIRGNFSYIGVLGSTAKIKTMWNALEKDGILRDELKNVHAPIGLPIRSQTPNEIAVSIAAEIIRVKNGCL